MNSPRTLARGVAPSRSGTLHARSVTGGIKVTPRPGATLRFGRGGEPDVELRVGEDDLRVSRRHGELTYRDRRWWLRNTGQQLLRLPHGRMMHTTTEPIPLATGYTPLFMKGSGHREHLVELYVTDHDEEGLVPRRRAVTLPPKRWPLADDERLVLVVLGQRYLLYEAGARPLSYREAAARLACLRTAENWTRRRIEHKVEAVRHRLSRGGDFPYPVVRDEVSAGPNDHTDAQPPDRAGGVHDPGATGSGADRGRTIYTWALVRRAHVRSTLGDVTGALDDLDRAEGLEPDTQGTLGERGNVYRFAGRYEEAVALYDRALALDPGYAWALGSRALANEALGRRTEALADLERAVEMNPGYAWAVAQRERSLSSGSSGGPGDSGDSSESGHGDGPR